MTLTGLLKSRVIEKEGNLGTAISTKNLRRGCELIDCLTDFPQLYIIRNKGLVLYGVDPSHVAMGMVFIPDATSDEIQDFSFSEVKSMVPCGTLDTRKLKDWMKTPRPKYGSGKQPAPLVFEIKDGRLVITEDHSRIKGGTWERKMKMFETHNSEVASWPTEVQDETPWNKIETSKLKTMIKAMKLEGDLVTFYCRKGETNMMFSAGGEESYITYLPDIMTEVCVSSESAYHLAYLKPMLTAIDCTKGAKWKGAPSCDIGFGWDKPLFLAGLDTKGRTKKEGLNGPRYIFALAPRIDEEDRFAAERFVKAKANKI